MFRKTSQSEETLFINLTPMIDVILTLLVFFITATRLYDWEEDKLDVAIPEVNYARPLTQAPDDLTISVAMDGTASLNGETVDLPDIRRKLKEAKERYADQGVIIRADGRTTHQRVADVMSACHQSGISRILFSVRDVGSKTPG